MTTLSDRTKRDINATIASVCKKNDFKKAKKPYWYRVNGDFVCAVHLDRRKVGKYPYFIELAFDLVSNGFADNYPFNLIGARLLIEQTLDYPQLFLKALDPASTFDNMEVRLAIIETQLDSCIKEDIVPLHDILSLKLLTNKYIDQNTLIIPLRIREYLGSIKI